MDQNQQKGSNATHKGPVFPYHVHNQVDFDNVFIVGRGFIYLDIQKWVSLFKYLQEFKVAY